IGVTGSDIEAIALLVDRGSVPDSATRRTPQLGSFRNFLVRLGRIRHRVSLPKLLASRGVESDDASPESAAFVIGLLGAKLLARSYRNIQAALIIRRGAGDASQCVIVHLGSPEFLAGDGIDGMGKSIAIAEVGHPSGAIAFDRD